MEAAAICKVIFVGPCAEKAADESTLCFHKELRNASKK